MSLVPCGADGWISTGVQHHVERAFAVDHYLKNDFIPVKVERNL